MTRDLLYLVNEAVEILDSAGIITIDRREMSNGIRITFTENSRTCGINFYNSKKRGFSVVPAGGDTDLSSRIKKILSISDSHGKEDINTWAGTDEAGKGDYMGPLTVAAVYVDPHRAKEFRSIGISDSKDHGNESIRKLAEMIRTSSSEFISVVSVSPIEYNRRFNELSKKGKNSLDLLAECHADAIKQLLLQTPMPECIIVDKFCEEKRIRHLLPDGDYRLDLRVRAESDTAVAAASILARDAYLEGLDRISQKYGIRAVAGSGQNTDRVTKEFVRQFGADVLDETVKLHFRNTLKVMSLFS